MRSTAITSFVLLISLSTAAIAADFDGSVPLSCTALKANSCLPTGKGCKAVKPETDIAPVFSIDFARKEVRSPYRTILLAVQNSTETETSLLLQGTERSGGWTARIDKATGVMTITVADNKGAFVAFGQCKAAQAAQ